MSFEVTTRPVIATPELAPPSLPAVIEKNPISIFTRHDSFAALMETRGESPVPVRRLTRAFSSSLSWGLVAAGAATVVAGGLTAIGLPWFAPLVAGGIGLLVGGVGGTYPGASTPLEVLGRNRPLRQKDLTFLAGSAEAGPLQQAVDGKLAERWIRQIDQQRVHGDAACADLEDIIAQAKTLPQSIQNRAARLLAVHDATLDDHGGQLTTLGEHRVTRLIDAVGRLDDADRPDCASQLMKRFFKGDLPLIRFEAHHSSRELYRALRVAMRPAPVIVPALPAPLVNAEPARD